MPSSYGEWADPGADPAVACRWQQRVGATDPPSVKRVLPDGCADLIVTGDGAALVVGPATRVHLPQLSAPTTVRGIRLRTEAIRAAFGVPASELQDRQVPLAALVDERLAERLTDVAWTGAPLPQAWSALPLDGRVKAATRRLWREPTVDVAQVATAVNLSGRQLRRLLLAETGLGPKTLQRVGRLQRFLALAEHRRLGTPAALAVLAADAGYADQAHLTREARELAGLPPARLLAERAGDTADRSPLKSDIEAII
ncbi:MAG: helix-turn-helix domain-containing protein [Actinomycetota bacterium]|nr:helix-turn-helix domain-containing protein [Actinomycetota bacterium]MDQ6945845.1 helix-turn-helix domain-containing protein [Actinomycetota bacterium]